MSQSINQSIESFESLNRSLELRMKSEFSISSRPGRLNLEMISKNLIHARAARFVDVIVFTFNTFCRLLRGQCLLVHQPSHGNQRLRTFAHTRTYLAISDYDLDIILGRHTKVSFGFSEEKIIRTQCFAFHIALSEHCHNSQFSYL